MAITGMVIGCINHCRMREQENEAADGVVRRQMDIDDLHLSPKEKKRMAKSMIIEALAMAALLGVGTWALYSGSMDKVTAIVLMGIVGTDLLLTLGCGGCIAYCMIQKETSAGREEFSSDSDVDF